MHVKISSSIIIFKCQYPQYFFSNIIMYVSSTNKKKKYKKERTTLPFSTIYARSKPTFTYICVSVIVILKPFG